MSSRNGLALAMLAASMVGGGLVTTSLGDDMLDDAGFEPSSKRYRPPSEGMPKRGPAIIDKPKRDPIPDTMTRQRRRAEERAARKRLPSVKVPS